MPEKEWTVDIVGQVTVYDETKEGAEEWVASNINIDWFDIKAEDNDSEEGDKYYVSYEMMGHHHEGFKTLEEATKKVEETGCLEHHGNEVEECKAIAIYERETGQEVWSL